MTIQTEKIYEFAYLAAPELDEASVGALKNEIHERIVKAGGSVREEQAPVRRRLAYPISKASHAYFISEYVMLTPEGQKALEKDIRAHKSILRHLFVSLTERVYKSLREKKVPQLPTMTREAKEKVLSSRRTITPSPRVEKPAEEKKADIAEIEKKLDEILGREL